MSGPDERELREEQRRLRFFRRLTDLAQATLARSPLTLPQAHAIVSNLRKTAERLFPGKAHVFDLVIAPRLRRVIRERFVIKGGRR